MPYTMNWANKNANPIYRAGEEIEYTGKTMVLHGAIFYEFEVVGDSHRIGWKGVTMEAPKHVQVSE